MILSKRDEFSDGQAVTTTAFGTSVMDLGKTGLGIGNVDHAKVVFQTDTVPAGGTSINFEVVTSDNADLSSPTVIGSTGPIATASFDTGATVSVLPLPDVTYKRYLGVRYTISGTYTSGTVSAFITPDAGQYRSYDRGYEV